MKLIKYLVGFGALLAMLFSVGAAKAQTTRLKVASWNVLSFEQEDKSGERAGFPVEPFVELIQEINPDVLVLNEFETASGRMGKEKMAEMASKLGMYSYFVESYPKNAGYYGNVILSKFPIVSSASKLFTFKHRRGEGYYDHNEGYEYYEYGSDQRSIGYIDILVPAGNSQRIIRVAGTHLDHVSDSNAKEYYQDPETVEFLSLNNPPYPTILMGDLNVMRLTQLPLIYDLADQCVNDWLDYVLTFPKGKFIASDSGTHYSGNLSDHNAVYVTVEVK